MPDILNILRTEGNNIAPSVYIESVEVNNNDYTFKYKLIDFFDSWINNNKVLNNIYVFLEIGDKNYKELLTTVKSSGVVKGNEISKEITIHNITGSNLTLKAYCGNEFLQGNITTEQIKTNDLLNKAQFTYYGNPQNYEYISKIKNLSILNSTSSLFDPSFITSSTEQTKTFLSEFHISYTPEKIALIGTLLKVEEFLEANSKFYNVIKKYPNIKKQALINSTVDIEKTTFFKKDLIEEFGEYKKINNSVTVYKVDDTRYDYYLTIPDDNEDPTQNSKFSLAIKICILDYSKVLFSLLKKDFRIAKKFVQTLLDLFIDYSKNSFISDIGAYIFQEILKEKEIQELKFAINTLLPVLQLYTDRQEDEILSFLLSSLHPLTTNEDVLNKLLKFLIKIEKDLENLFNFNEFFNNGQELESNYLEFYKEVKNNFIENIDYKYDENNGFDIISNDTLENRRNIIKTGIETISLDYRKLRDVLESNKYYSSARNLNLETPLTSYSISLIDLQNSSYDFINQIDTTSTNIFKEAYYKILEKNNFTFAYSPIESAFFQLGALGINIKSISDKANESVNNLQKTTIFDPNLDSKQKSLEYLKNTGAYDLFLYLDETKFLGNITTGLFQREAFLGLPLGSDTPLIQASVSPPLFPFSDSLLNNIDTKSKVLFYYDTIFQNNIIFTGSNYSLYELTEASGSVNEVFTKNLKQFNRYYIIVEKASAATQTTSSFNYDNELSLNIQSIYLNRVVTTGSILIKIEDL